MKLPAPETPVRELARRDVVRLLADDTIAEALANVRGQDIRERIVYFYVTDAAGRLAGVVPTRRLLLSDPSARVGEIMIRPVIAVQESEPFARALETILQHRLMAIPVVDATGRLAGMLDVTAFTGELVNVERRGAAEEVFQLVGIQVEEERTARLGRIVRTRFPWLICNLASGLAGAVLAARFDVVFRSAVALAFFVPLVLTIAESVAMQSVTTTVQRLLSATGAVPLWREFGVGLGLGLGVGAVTYAFGAAWLDRPEVALIVAAAIIAGAGVGAGLGNSLPRIVHRWRLDPKVASGPAVLALTDLGALACYLGLAALVL